MPTTDYFLSYSPNPATANSPRRRRHGRRPLGPFSYLVMRSIHKLPPRQCYGLKIEEHISEHLGELVDLAQCYVTLKRLQAKRLIVGKQAPAPSGTAHKVTLYRLTAAGKEAIAAATIFYRLVETATR